MEPFLVLPFPGTRLSYWSAHGACLVGSGRLSTCVSPSSDLTTASYPPGWVATASAPFHLFYQLSGPGEQAENQEEDADDLELESDEDHSKLRTTGPLPGAEEEGAAAHGSDGTINPPFP